MYNYLYLILQNGHLFFFMFNKSFLDTLGESITMEGAIISDKIAIERHMNLQTFHLFWL